MLNSLVGITGGTSLAEGDRIGFEIDYYNQTIWLELTKIVDAYGRDVSANYFCANTEISKPVILNKTS